MIRRKVKGVARQCKKDWQHSFSSLKVEGTILRCLMKMTKGQTLFSRSARYVKKEKETILLWKRKATKAFIFPKEPTKCSLDFSRRLLMFLPPFLWARLEVNYALRWDPPARKLHEKFWLCASAHSLKSKPWLSFIQLVKHCLTLQRSEAQI